MIIFKRAGTKEELQGILALQKNNLPKFISEEEKKTQGFVTVHHSYEILEKMNNAESAIIAKDGNEVIAYLLAMRKELKNDIPVLVPMFEILDKIIYKGMALSEYNYIVVGQVCVSKNHRGTGLLDKCYDEYKKYLSSQYDFAVTEIDKENLRSIKAHKRIGFELLHNYNSPLGRSWDIIIWNWS